MKIFKTNPLTLLLAILLLQGCEDHPGEPQNPDDLPGAPVGVFYALAENNMLYELEVKNPSQAKTTIKIETQYPAEKILAIDFRPATGELYAFSDYHTTYVVNVSQDRIIRANPIDPKLEQPTRPISVRLIGFDFDPVRDRVRVMSSSGKSIVYTPHNMDVDPEMRYVGHLDLTKAALAYGNNYAGATNSVLYTIDPIASQLLKYEDERSVEKQVVGDLGEGITEIGEFDISPRTSSLKEYGLATIKRGDKWEIDHVNLETGKLSRLGDLPNGNFLGIAIPTPVAYAVTAENSLISFSPMDQVEKDSQRLIVEKAITGIPGDAKIVSIDMSVENGSKLYAFASNSKIYQIDYVTAKATEKSTLSMPFDLTNDPAFGIDFDPFNNSLRIVNSTRHALIADLGTGRVSQFGALTFNGEPLKLDAVAFTNSQVGVADPKDIDMYAIDSEAGRIYKTKNNTYEVERMAEFNIRFDKFNGFDIGGKYSSYGYGLFTVDGKTGLYEFGTFSGEIYRRISVIPYSITGFTLGKYLYNEEAI